MLISVAARFPRHRVGRCLFGILVALLVTPLAVPGAWADDALAQAESALDGIEKQLDSPKGLSDQQLTALEEEIASIRDDAFACIREAEEGIDKLDSELVILRPQRPKDAKAPEGEAAAEAEAPVSPEIARQIDDLQKQKASLEGRLAKCRLILLRGNELQSRVDQIQREARTRQLLVRGPSLVAVVQESLSKPERWWELTTQLAAKSTGWDAISPAHLGGAAAVGLLGFVLGRIVPRRLRDRAARFKVEQQEVSVGLVHAAVACGVSYAPILLALGGISTYVTLIPRTPDDLPFVAYLMWGLFGYFLIAAAIRTLLNPCPPATYSLSLPEAVAQPLSRRGRVLVLVALIWWLVQRLGAVDLLDETLFLLANHVIGLAWVLNAIWMIWLLRRLEGWKEKRAVPLLLSLALFAGLLAAWIGYRSLGALIILGITLTLVVVGLALLLNQLLSELLEGLDAGRYRWQQAVRGWIGLKADEYVPGLGWLRLLVSFAVWVATAFLVLRVWGAGDVTDAVLRYVREGFVIAGLRVVPGQLFWAFVTLGVLLTLTRWLKARLDKKWLAQTRMERSAREALVTTFGYVAVALSVLVALSIAGIKFTNLAIIAGALSVGIGFGMQNIVNNFVSGLIMLVERPVRTGDWIVVGATEGHVKRISIRSTTIQTFDRADVIVPNSELISGQVTNLTLRNSWGRIKVPIGVAYGSDTAKVRDILLEIANNHDDVIKGNPDLPDPFVLFMAFADSSLNFELRAMVRDVGRRVRVLSEINFAIDAAFREQGIEIPFPQRDLNFRGPLQIERNSTEPDD